MKAHYKTKNGRITVEIEGDSPKAIFKGIAEVQELFEPDQACGACASQAIQFRFRKVDKYEYFEVFCTDCSAALQFGQKREGGGLFPKRKDSDGNPLSQNGWLKWKDRERDAAAVPITTARRG